MSPDVALFLCGDVMTGRGIDQVLPHPSDPHLPEEHIEDARAYVRLAENANGPIPAPVDYAYVWGDALSELAAVRTDARIVNLETSVTRSDDHWRGKGINYRMHPDNVPCITAAHVDCCVLANNHVLDYGSAGLEETLDTLRRAGVKTAGAGRTLGEARAPAVLDVPGKGRVLVFGFGTGTSGIETSWAATDTRAGVELLRDLSASTVERIRDAIARTRQPGDVVVASIHWGGNWGYEVPDAHVEFAHALVRAGVDVVHGHSLHHVGAIEVCDGKLVLYGCGDFINDYEGIGGHESFRGDLSLMYLPTIGSGTGRLVDLRMTPMCTRNFRPSRAVVADVEWLRDAIDNASRRFGFRTALDVGADGVVRLRISRPPD